jgi:hypothetical protein
MDNKAKYTLLTISDKINISAQVYAHTETYAEQASQLRLSVLTLNTIRQNCEEIKITYVQCRPLYKQWKSLKFLQMEEVESSLAAWFKQEHESNAFIDGIHLYEALYISAYLEIANFSASSGRIERFKRKHNTVYKTQSTESKSNHSETVDD